MLIWLIKLVELIELNELIVLIEFKNQSDSSLSQFVPLNSSKKTKAANLGAFGKIN
jgi:hypothetical protein